MKENNKAEKMVCPECNCEFTQPPALSRIDNKTLICPDCGTRQALENVGVSVAEQDRIIAEIHKYE